MKKIFTSALLVLAALTSVMADGSGLPIGLIKNPPGTHNPAPTIKPLSVTDDDAISVEASLSNDAIILTTSSSTVAQVTIIKESGTVIYNQIVILGNEPAEVATLGWPSGSYTLYIEVGDDLYEGSFEL